MVLFLIWSRALTVEAINVTPYRAGVYELYQSMPPCSVVSFLIVSN